MGNASVIKSIVIFFLTILIAVCSMFVVVNADKIFFNNNVEQVEPGEGVYITLSANYIKF